VNEDKAARYQRLKRRADVLSLAWAAAMLAGLVVFGGHVALRDAAEAILPGAPVLAFVVLLSLLNEAGSLPIAFYTGFLVERRYGLSNERLRGWAADQAKSFGIGILLGAPAAALVYWTIRTWPDRWWLPAGLMFAAIIVALANLAPVLLLPVFYSVKPLAREGLRARLMALAERAGARVLGAYEWGLGDKTRKANAALTGIGSTRRILVSDTMLDAYSEEEIEVVLAHELAHHVHGDIWKGIAFESALVIGGFYLASVVLARFAPAAGLRGVADVAGLPLLMLAAGGLSLVMVPLALAMSRSFERSADRFALELTRNPSAFVSAMRRLAAQNLAEDDPPRIVQWLFYSHPPIRERIAAAQARRA
jgi:Zn-dependent protease with chaperone function